VPRSALRRNGALRWCRVGHRGRDPVRTARDPIQRLRALRGLDRPL